MTSWTFSPFRVGGCLNAIPSKSEAHRVLIVAALADAPTNVVLNGFTSADIEATIRCIKALGATVLPLKNCLHVIPGEIPAGQVAFDCGESGSTLRFMLPVAAARLKNGAEFIGAGRLPNRPLGELCDGLRANGCNVSANSVPLAMTGRLTGGEFVLPGNVSSQYITGLLLALPITQQGGSIRLVSQLESTDYVVMTIKVLKRFGIVVETLADGWRVRGGQSYHSPGTFAVEGDWSNAAALLGAGAIDGSVTVSGLNVASAQGDRRIVEFLREFGAEIAVNGDSVTVSSRPLHGVTLDMSENPDLFPVLAVLAAAAEGRTVLANAARLRLKECDRLSGMAGMLTAVGVHVTETEDSLIIEGGVPLHGARVNVHNDHRLVMAAALLAQVAKANIEIAGVEAVNKSYPGFVEDWNRLERKEALL